MSDKKCKPFEHSSFVGSWWICCECKTLNGDIRDNCKFCNHERCGEQPEIKTIPIKQEDGTIMIATLQAKVEEDPKKVN